MRQVIYGGGSVDTLNTASTEYHTLHGSSGDTWSATEGPEQHLTPGNGIVHSLKILLSASPGGGGSYIFTLRQSAADTALTVTITDPATSAELTTSEIVYVPDNRWDLKCAPSGSPTATPTVQWELLVEDTDDINRSWLSGGGGGLMDTIITEYSVINGTKPWMLLAATTNSPRSPMPLSGTLRNFYVRLNGAPGAGTNYQMSVGVSGVNALAATISGTATTGSDTGTYAVSAGNTIYMVSNPGSIPTARRAFWGVCFEPDEPYYAPVLSSSDDTLNPAATEYNSLFSVDQSWTATETTRRKRVKMGVMKNLYIRLGDTPGIGTTWTFTVMLNGSATSLITTVADTATAGSNTTDSVELQDDDEVSLQCVGTGSPLGVDAGWSVAYFTYEPCMYSSREGNN